MNIRFDRDVPISAWLAAEAPDGAPTRLVEHTRERLRTTQQRRRWGPTWRFPDMKAQAKLAIFAAAVLVVAVAGINLLLVDENVGGPTVAPSQVPMASPSPQPSAVTVGEFPFGLLTPDIRYAMTRDTVQFSVVFPTSGWRSNGDFYIGNAGSDAELFFWTSAPDGVFADPGCAA
jgi:hypothetical protein